MTGFEKPDVSILNQNVTNNVNPKYCVCILSSSGISWFPNDIIIWVKWRNVVCPKKCRCFSFENIRFDWNLGVHFHSLVPRHGMPMVDFFCISLCVFRFECCLLLLLRVEFLLKTDSGYLRLLLNEHSKIKKKLFLYFGMASARRPKETCRPAPRDRRNTLDVWSCGQYLLAYYEQTCLFMSRESSPWLGAEIFRIGMVVSTSHRFTTPI